MRAFKQPKVIILGGSDKGAEYDEVVAVAKETGARVIAIGQTGQKIYELCQYQGVPVEREEGLMPEVVAVATRIANPGDIVILSPASASFDQYKSYSERGEQFIAAVNNLQKIQKPTHPTGERDPRRTRRYDTPPQPTRTRP